MPKKTDYYPGKQITKGWTIVEDTLCMTDHGRKIFKVKCQCGSVYQKDTCTIYTLIKRDSMGCAKCNAAGTKTRNSGVGRGGATRKAPVLPAEVEALGKLFLSGRIG